jgi:hypothetical protein
MRKVFWMGAAGLVASASLVYLAADFACRHPHSWLSRCVTASMAKPTPRELKGTTTHADAGVAVGQTVCGMTPPCPNRQPKLVLEPVAEECPDNPVVSSPAEACEPIQVPMPGQTIAIEGTEPGAGMGAVMPGTAVEGVISSGTEPYRKTPSSKQPGEIPEECEVVPPSMPEPQVCGQEDFAYMPPYPEGEKSKVTPVDVPYVEENCEATGEEECPLSVWFSWLKEMVGKQKSRKKCPMPKKSDLVPNASPPADEALDPSRPPSCVEDPDHDYQYSGCPHMGGCQRGGVCCPPPATTPTPKVKHHKKKKVHAQPVSRSHKGKTKDSKDSESSDGDGVDPKESHTGDAKVDDIDMSQPD